jgi:membrane protease YdiL (CAAX protease family)
LNRSHWKRLALLLAILPLSQGSAYLLLALAHLEDQPYSGLFVNSIFLLACLGSMRLLGISRHHAGLADVPQHRRLHAFLCLVIFSGYVLYYLLGVRISALRPITPATIWALSSYLVVAFAEELYFRGILYHALAERYRGAAAVFVTAIVFALVHLRQGPAALVRFPTGALWSSVRYSTGMIFMLIIPIHFAYNATWLLFQGNWDNPPNWAFLLPLAELLGAVLIVRFLPAHAATPLIARAVRQHAD